MTSEAASSLVNVPAGSKFIRNWDRFHQSNPSQELQGSPDQIAEISHSSRLSTYPI